MTAIADTDSAQTAAVASGFATRDRSRTPGWPVVIGSAALGIVVIGLSYRLSAQGSPADLYYVVFWVGMLAGLLPVSAKLVAIASTRTTRLSAVLLVGFVTFVPKLLRNPGQPLYHDEYAHWREAVDVAQSGRLFRPNAVIPIVEFFPGTSALTVSTQFFSGMSMWAAGTFVVLVMHVAGLIAVFLIGEVLLGSARAGAVAALIYAVNPSAIYFDTQYAYESIAINLFLWTLALTALAGRAESGCRRRHLVAATVTAFGCVVVHHLSTIFLIAALATVGVAGTIRRRRMLRTGETAPPEMAAWWYSLAATILLAVGWVALVARPTLTYLSPYFGNSVRQLNDMRENSEEGRQLLAANVQPLWEQALTAAAPLVLAGVAVSVAMMLRRGVIRLGPAAWGMTCFGLLYFVSLPFILAPSGAEGARRSWGFAYVGIALIVALAVVHWPRHRPAWVGGGRRALTAALLFTVLVIGNVGGGLNDPYRFPGPFRWGTDTNSASEEARTVARELFTEVGRVRVVSDAYTALQLAAYGGMAVAAPSLGFPAWELTQSAADPTPELAGMLVSSGYDYLVVDLRMAQEPPFNGHNFGEHDPLLGYATPMQNLTRLDSVPWATRVISTEHLRVYRLDLTRIATGVMPR